MFEVALILSIVVTTKRGEAAQSLAYFNMDSSFSSRQCRGSIAMAVSHMCISSTYRGLAAAAHSCLKAKLAIRFCGTVICC